MGTFWRMSSSGELELPRSAEMNDLEARAWAVVYHHNREISSPSVCKALDHFLELVKTLAQTDWPHVESQLQRLTSPILDNNYAYKVMAALQFLHSLPITTLSVNYRWAPRGFLMYGLSHALHEARIEDSQEAGLSPKFILQWLSRLSLTTSPNIAAETREVNNALHIMVHTMFSLWSCRYDADPKARTIKYEIAIRKMNTINTEKLIAEAYSGEADYPLLAKTTCLYDFYWLKHYLRLHAGGYVEPKVRTQAPGPPRPLSDLVHDLVTDFKDFKAPKMAEYRTKIKFASFAAEIIDCLPYHFARLAEARDFQRILADDQALQDCMRIFLFDSPGVLMKAWEIRFAREELRTATSTRSLFQSCVDRYTNLTTRVKIGILAGEFDEIEFPWMNVDEIFRTRATEAEVSGILQTVSKLHEAHPWRRKFLSKLSRLQPDASEPGRLSWILVGLQAGSVDDSDEILKLYTALVRRSETECEWYKKYARISERTEMELLVLTAACVKFECAHADVEFDSIAARVFDEVMSILRPFEQGLERIALLALALGIYLGNVNVPRLIRRLSIRAVQCYSLAWCLDGMERLWKSNIWTTPRHNCESPERVDAQIGSTAMLTLDHGSLQSLVQQVEGAYPRMAKLVHSAREDSLAVDAILMNKESAPEALHRLRQRRSTLDSQSSATKSPREKAPFDSPFKSSPSECAGDYTALVGTVSHLDIRPNHESGMWQLVRRLKGSHVMAPTSMLEAKASDAFSFPSSVHVYLELQFRGVAAPPELGKMARKTSNSALMSSADSFMKAVRSLQ